jgi:hypothetical protein
MTAVLKFRRTALIVAAMLVVASLAWARPGHDALQARTVAADSMAGSHQASGLAHQLAQMRVATAKYVTNLQRAKKDGYGIITPNMPGMGYHYLNPNIAGFDVRKPQILVYEKTSGGWQLGALEWVFPSMPTKATLPHATYGFFPAACHYKDGTFVPAAAQSDCAAKSPSSGSAFNFWHPPLYTMHVWIWYPNPDGLYSSTNPLVNDFTSKAM